MSDDGCRLLLMLPSYVGKQGSEDSLGTLISTNFR